MQEGIHPNYRKVKVTCSCGHSFTTKSTYAEKEMHLDICSHCHPFYTGKQKLIDTAGRVERFNKKYGIKKSAKKN